MERFHFSVEGYEPVLEHCADRDDACRRAQDVSLQLSAAWGHPVSVQVRDAQGRQVCVAPDLAAGSTPLPQLLQVLVQAAIEHQNGKARAAFFQVDAHRKTLHHVTGMSQAYAQCVDGFPIGPQSAACGLCVHLGQPIITPDVFAEPRWTPWLALPRQFDFRAVWSFPIAASHGEMLGTFAMYHNEPTEPTSRELDLAGALTRTAAVVMTNHGRQRTSPSGVPRA
jgi:GAF domain-containing protein